MPGKNKNETIQCLFCGITQGTQLERCAVIAAGIVFSVIVIHTGDMKKLSIVVVVALLFAACASNPLTGKRTMAFVNNSSLFPSSFAQYSEFLKDNTVVTGTPDAELVAQVGERLAEAARKWLDAEGFSHYLDAYQWEINLVRDNTVNAWCLPGGKIVVYTGILPVTQTEEGLAVVLGHEICHALLNHGQQRMSAGILQDIGSVAVSIMTESESTREAYSTGSTVLGTLPFSRSHESEADHYGLILMAIAGYNPDAAVPFWQRMAALGGGTLEFLSTHPSDTTRIRQLQGWVPGARQKAAEFGVQF